MSLPVVSDKVGGGDPYGYGPKSRGFGREDDMGTRGSARGLGERGQGERVWMGPGCVR